MRIILAFLILSVLYTGAALAQIYIANQGSGTVSVLSDPIVTVDVGGAPTAVAVTPDGDFVYVANVVGTVSVIQTSDNKVIDTIDVGSESFGVAVTPDGSHVYVTNCSSNTVSVIQTSDNTVVATVDVGQCPTGVAISNNTSVFVANT
jgi:YVTN family beta-propeller protein